MENNEKEPIVMKEHDASEPAITKIAQAFRYLEIFVIISIVGLCIGLIADILLFVKYGFSVAAILLLLCIIIFIVAYFIVLKGFTNARFEADDNNIRFNEIIAEVKRLNAENKQLKKDIESLKNK